MSNYIKQLASFVINAKCYDEYFIKYNFLDVPCMKSTISKLLGIVIIAGSLMVKVPQITKIRNNKSAVGLSLLSVILELFAITSNMSYSFIKGFPFSAYGEALFLAIQTVVIAALVLHYNGSPTNAILFTAAYTASVGVLLSGLVSVDLLWSMQALNVPIIIAAKLLQIVANFRNGSTGQLSAATVIMLFFGSVARIFTSIQETGDTLIIITYLVASSLNGVLAGQVFYYWKATSTTHQKKKSSKDGKKKK